MRRREFITLLGGAAVAWLGRSSRGRSSPSGCGASACSCPRPQTMRNFKPGVAAFLQALAQLGWTIGRNVRIDIRWATTNAAEIRRHAAELVALAPDVILAFGTSTVGPMLQATRTVPIVFPVVGDPVGAGFVDSLARPGGNATGFTVVRIRPEREMAGAAQADRAGRDARGGPSRSQPSPPASASSASSRPWHRRSGWRSSPVNVRDAAEIERAVAAFARAANGGLIVTPSALAVVHRDLIVTLAARHKLPAVYFERYFVAAGGLISYGPDFVDQFRQAAGYVDRILKGEKPADLPVQAPTKYELVDQPQDRQGARPRRAAVAARARRRGDRMRCASRKLVRSSRWKSGPSKE